MIKLREILYELGDGGIPPFPYPNNFNEQYDDDLGGSVISKSFKDNFGREIKIFFGQSRSLLANVDYNRYFQEMKVVNLPKNYYAMGYEIEGKQGSHSDDRQIETGQYYLKLFTTLVNIIKDFVKKYNPDGLAIIKTFNDRNEKDAKFNKQKEKIYVTWLSKALPDYKLRMEGDHIFFDKNSLNEIKITGKITPEMVWELELKGRKILGFAKMIDIKLPFQKSIKTIEYSPIFTYESMKYIWKKEDLVKYYLELSKYLKNK